MEVLMLDSAMEEQQVMQDHGEEAMTNIKEFANMYWLNEI